MRRAKASASLIFVLDGVAGSEICKDNCADCHKDSERNEGHGNKIDYTPSMCGERNQVPLCRGWGGAAGRPPAWFSRDLLCLAASDRRVEDALPAERSRPASG